GLAEEEDRVADRRHLLGVAVYRLERELLALVRPCGERDERRPQRRACDQNGRESGRHGRPLAMWMRQASGRTVCRAFDLDKRGASLSDGGKSAGSGMAPMRFEGTSAYVATDDLKVAVNAAITLERPLLVKGEPGTGKTVLALEIAKALGAPLIEWHVKSTTKALQGLYEYDAVSRLRDSQLGDARVQDIRNYIK